VADRYDRAVAAVLGAAVVTCAAAAAFVRPAPLPAHDAARWVALAAAGGSDRHRYGRSWQIDAFNIGTDHVGFAGQVPSVRRGDPLVVWGWALDPRARRPAARFLYRVDAGPWRDAAYHLARPDVALRFNLAHAADSGYGATIATAGLAPGPHEAGFATADARGAVLPTTRTVRFVVIAP
jgi:hypothetical protein